MDIKKLQERVKKHSQKLAKAQKDMQLAEQALKEEERKIRSRRLIVLGAHAETLCNNDPEFRAKLQSFVDKQEKKAINRKLFDFLPENQTAQNAPSGDDASDESKFG